MDLEGEFRSANTRGAVRSIGTDSTFAYGCAARSADVETNSVIKIGTPATDEKNGLLIPVESTPGGNRSHVNRVTDLASQITSLYPMLAALAGSKIKLDLEVDTCPRGELHLDSHALMQILINLVRNSAEAIVAKGTILISAKPFPSSVRDSSHVLITVEGDGPGIPLALLDTVFDTEATQSTQQDCDHAKMRFRPRGLGLRIVRELTESAGGHIRAVRLPDRGSRFEVVFPVLGDTIKPSIA